MEAATAFSPRPSESANDAAAAATNASRSLAVTATYLLSEEGRKASLLAGGDGRAAQEIAIHVPANRLHLVSVDANGVARLKLRPRYQLDGDRGISRIDAPPIYDTPPDLEELFREAARNHQLERTYQIERRAARTKRHEAERERRTQIAQGFLGDRSQRALVHPPPTPKRCYLAAEQGRMIFDADADEVPARQVPEEAHRRFRADLRDRKERNLQARAAQLAVHEEKKRFIAEWIATHGTREQQARQAAGVLPIDETIEAMADQAFAAVAERPRYARDGAPRLQAHLRQFSQYADVVVTGLNLRVTSANATKATAIQWTFVQELQRLLPDSTVALREHKLTWKCDPTAPPLTVFGVLVSCKAGPFTVRREYEASTM